MKKIGLIVFILFLAVHFSLGSKSEGRDIKIMISIGLLDVGEDAKLITPRDFQNTKSHYKAFKKLLTESITLKEMVKDGWVIEHVLPLPDDFYIFIFQK